MKKEEMDKIHQLEQQRDLEVIKLLIKAAKWDMEYRKIQIESNNTNLNVI